MTHAKSIFTCIYGQHMKLYVRICWRRHAYIHTCMHVFMYSNICARTNPGVHTYILQKNIYKMWDKISHYSQTSVHTYNDRRVYTVCSDFCFLDFLKFYSFNFCGIEGVAYFATYDGIKLAAKFLLGQITPQVVKDLLLEVCCVSINIDIITYACIHI